MSPEEKMKQTIIALEEDLKERIGLRQKALESAEKTYSELNNSELLVVTGSFAVIINFLSGKQLPSGSLCLLNIGLGFFVITLILKSYLHRRNAKRLEKQIEIGDDQSRLDARAHFILKKVDGSDQITEDEVAFVKNYGEKSKENESKIRELKNAGRTGDVLNDIEFVFYIAGLIFIFLFFLASNYS